MLDQEWNTKKNTAAYTTVWPLNKQPPNIVNGEQCMAREKAHKITSFLLFNAWLRAKKSAEICNARF